MNTFQKGFQKQSSAINTILLSPPPPKKSVIFTDAIQRLDVLEKEEKKWI